MQAIVARLLSAKRKAWLRSKPMFEPYANVSEAELDQLQHKLGCHLPESLRAWLLELGYGDINDELSFRSEWFSVIDRGELQGHVFFAQDDLGNFYSVGPADGRVHFVCRSAPEYALMAHGFQVFMEELERLDYQVVQWAESLPALPYDWSV